MPQLQNGSKSRRWPWIIALVVVFFIGAGVGSNIQSATKDTTTITTDSNTSPKAIQPASAPVNNNMAAQPTSATTDNSAAAQPTSAPTSNNAATHHKLNETVTVDNTWQVTVTSTKTDPGDGEINVPAAGNTYILITVSLKNISSEQQNASGMIQFSLRDATGTTYNQNPTYGGSDPSGTVAAGDPLKGTLAYEVPTSSKTFVLNFTSGLLSDQVSWDITI